MSVKDDLSKVRRTVNEHKAKATGHTPGPWTIGTSADHTPLIMVPAPGWSGFGIACINRMPRLGIVSGDMDANARLIAAAPDMFDALAALLDRYVALADSGDCGNWNPEEEREVIAARAALAKARGE